MELKKTSLYEKHIANNATMVDFAGYAMPIYYTNIKKEHEAVRNNVGMFDVSHMGEIKIKGNDAEKYLEWMFSNNVATLKDKSCAYGFLCKEDGGVIDDLIVYKITQNHYLLVVNASNETKAFKWLLENQKDFDVEVENASNNYSLIALQGPNSKKVIEKTLNFEVCLKPFTFYYFNFNNEDILISATGYTGEDGYEIYGSHKAIVALWDLLEKEGVMACGLGARDTLRFEAGFPLYGNELSEEITPVEAGLNFAISWNKDFLGKNSLLELKNKGLSRKIVGLELKDKGIIRNSYKVYYNDKEVGYVTTGYLSPTLNKALAFALIDVEASKLNTEVEVEVRNKRLKAVVCNKKFYQKEK